MYLSRRRAPSFTLHINFHYLLQNNTTASTITSNSFVEILEINKWMITPLHSEFPNFLSTKWNVWKSQNFPPWTYVTPLFIWLSVQTVITPIIWWWLGAVPSLYVWVHRRQEWQISRTHTWLVSKDFSVCVGSLKEKISGWRTSHSVSVSYSNCRLSSTGLETVFRALGYSTRWYEDSLCLKEKMLYEKG